MIKKRKYPDKWILAMKGYSTNPKDSYLDIVLAYLPNNKITPYVTWIYNHSDGGFHEGHYYQWINTAIAEFLERGYIKLNKKFIKQHDAIETHYVMFIDDPDNSDREYMEQCEIDEAQLIGVYLHKPEGGIECITDHFNGRDAMRIVRYISNRYELPVMYQPKEIHYGILKPIE
jgi:hypothetical protein